MFNVPRLYITQPNYYIVKSLEKFGSCLDVPISINDITDTLDDEARQGDGEAKDAFNRKTMTVDMIEYLERAISLVRSKHLEIINRQVKKLQSFLCVKPGVQCAKSDAEV